MVLTLLGPIKQMRLRYWPLLMIYFSYGFSGLSKVATTFWQKEDLGLSAEQLLAIAAWASFVWTAKIVVGQLVDCVKLFGSRRKVYVYLGALFLMLATIVHAGLAGRHPWVIWLGDEYIIWLIASIMFAIGFVMQDVTADTMTTEVVDRTVFINGVKQQRKEHDVKAELAMVQVYARISLFLGVFFGAGLGGWLAANFDYELVFWLQFLLPLISITGALFVRLNPIDESEVRPINPLILGGGLGFALFSVMVGIFQLPFAQEMVFVVSAVLLSSLMALMMKEMPSQTRKTLVMIFAALFIYRCSPPVGPGMSWWLIDDLGFDQIFFGRLQQIGALTAILSLWFLSDMITRQALKTAMLWVIVLETLLFLPDLMLYHGVHEQIGVSAQFLALFDTAAVSPLSNIAMVLMLSIIAFYAPVGNRGTWFALAASFMNLALTAADMISKYLNKAFVVTRQVTDEAGVVTVAADYTLLGTLIVICMLWTFVIPFLAISFLVKDTR